MPHEVQKTGGIEMKKLFFVNVSVSVSQSFAVCLPVFVFANSLDDATTYFKEYMARNYNMPDFDTNKIMQVDDISTGGTV
jgi:hypothetical protein